MNNLFTSGGFVMWPLLLCSIASLTCILERIFYWSVIDWHNKNTLEIIFQKFIKYPDDLLKYLRKNNNYPLARILIKANDYKNQDPESFHLALTYAIQSSIKDIKKFDNIFSTIITISPCLLYTSPSPRDNR